MRRVDLGGDAVGRLLLRLSLPAMLGAMAMAGLSVADTWFVARLGTEAMAALTLCLPVRGLIMALAAAAGTGVSSLLSRTLGRGDLAAADNVAWHALLLAGLGGVALTVAGLGLLDEMLLLMGCPPAIYPASRRFLLIVTAASALLLIPLIIGSILQGEGNTLWSTLGALLGGLLTVVLDPLLIWGGGPFPALGLPGSAGAAALAHAGVAVVLGAVMWRRPLLLTWSPRNFRFSPRLLGDIGRVALPALVMELAGLAVMVALNRALLLYGYAALAAWGIFVHVRGFFIMPVNGLSTGLMPLAGYAAGARAHDRLKESLLKSCALSLALLLPGWWLLQAQAGWLVGFFTRDAALGALAAAGMRLATLAAPCVGPIIMLYTVLQAMGRGVSAMLLSLARQLLLLGAVLLLSRWLGFKGVWLALSCTEAISALLAAGTLLLLWKKLQKSRGYRLIVLRPGRYYLRRLRQWLRYD